MIEVKLIFICHQMTTPSMSSLRGNLNKVKNQVATFESDGYVALCPYIELVEKCINRRIPQEQLIDVGISINKTCIDACDYVFITGPNITSGIVEEAKYAFLKNVPVYIKSKKLRHTYKNHGINLPEDGQIDEESFLSIL